MSDKNRTSETNQGHAPSWYAHSANDKTVRPSLEGEHTADVCIVGAGFTGVSAALQLAENGYKVIVVEGERVGFGASGRNGGQIVNGYSRDLRSWRAASTRRRCRVSACRTRSISVPMPA